ncbi:hypothetical protein JHK85_055546 [Glycine max]|uniref:Uncharacterized protein n=1 Tax=Glycine soja TaxID=3848 RepID=A0A0B2PUF5_GLYSO|nr:hypothetical protein JHK85_055546 [Glycine max]KHN11373.1 hypothetical protein glysoja_036070 [Glycine soja]
MLRLVQYCNSEVKMFHSLTPLILPLQQISNSQSLATDKFPILLSSPSEAEGAQIARIFSATSSE